MSPKLIYINDIPIKKNVLIFINFNLKYVSVYIYNKTNHDKMYIKKEKKLIN